MVNVTTEQQIWQEKHAQFKNFNTKMLYTHCHGHAQNVAVKDACFKVDIKVTFEMTREICKLIKESLRRNNRIEEIRKTTKNQAKSVHSFCPTRWTVRGETLDSIINNYDQLVSLWEWSLQKHCVKCVQIGSFFWSVFSRIRARKNSVYGHVSYSEI